MARFRFAVSGHVLDLLTPTKGISDGLYVDSADFNFRTPEWEGLEKWAHFSNPSYNNGEEVSYLLVGDEISSERGLNLPAGIWDVYVHGDYILNGETVKRMVTYSQSIQIVQAGIDDGNPLAQISPTEGEQILAKASDAYNDRITAATATFEEDGGDASVDVEIAGEDGTKRLDFTFKNIRGATGGVSEDSIAYEFNESYSYSKGEYVFHDGVLYTSNNNRHWDLPWDPNDFSEAVLADDVWWCNEQINGIDNVLTAFRNIISRFYDRRAAYDVGDYTIQLQNFSYGPMTLFRCTTAIPYGGEAWNFDHWEEVKVGTELARLRLLTAQAFNPLTSYNAGQYVTYDSDLYKVIRPHSGAWDSADFSRVYLANEVSDIATSLDEVRGRNTIYCYGDSLTEGVGGYVMQPDNMNAYMAYSYPAWLSQSLDVLNLGARGEDIHAIMARQGADPIVIDTAFTIPASKDTPVKIGELSRIFTYGEGTGFTSKDGNLVKVNKEVESPGLNPCVINGVEGIIYRELTSSVDDASTYDYYFRRLEDGVAVSVPVDTEVQTYAMRYYRNGYAVIWMGANGGYVSHQDFVAKVQAMVEYGQYKNYLVILAREFAEEYARDIIELLTDEDGFCHVIYLMDELPYRGYAMAGISTNTIDTSEWVTTDPIKKNAPLLCDYLSGQSGEDQFGGLHFSAWGYKAIAKLVEEKLMRMIGASKSSDIVPVPTEGTDEYGHYVYKLPAPRTFNGAKYLNTHIPLYEDVVSNWTLVCKYTGAVECDDGYPCNIFNCIHDGVADGVMVRYTSASAPSVNLGAGAFAIGAENSNTSINLDDTNVMIIVKDGDYYRFYCNNTTCAYGTALNYPLTSDKAHELPLIFGGRWSTSGQEVQYLTKYTLLDARVYDTALSNADAVALYNELAEE